MVIKSCTTRALVLGEPRARTAKLGRGATGRPTYGYRYPHVASSRLPPLRRCGLHPPAETHLVADKSPASTVSRGARIFRELIRTNRCAFSSYAGNVIRGDDYLNNTPRQMNTLLAAKHLAGDDGVQVLAKVRAQLAAISEGTAPAIHTRAQRSGDEPAEWPRWFTGWSCQA